MNLKEMTDDRDRWRQVAIANQRSRLERIATAAMQGILVGDTGEVSEIVTYDAVAYAGALMERLDRKRD